MAITKEDYDKALEIVAAYEEENNVNNKHWLTQDVEDTKILEDVERLRELNHLAEVWANEFTAGMSVLEDAISDALTEVSQEARNETGYYQISDVTCDINVKCSWDWEF